MGRKVVRRCAVTDGPYFQMYYIPRYFYRRLFVQRVSKYQWQRRAVALDHGERGESGGIWRSGEGKREREMGGGREKEEQAETARGRGGRKTKRATAIIVDAGGRKKNDACINHDTRVYLRVASATLRLSSCPMMDVYHVRQRSLSFFAEFPF